VQRLQVIGHSDHPGKDERAMSAFEDDEVEIDTLDEDDDVLELDVESDADDDDPWAKTTDDE
jgi:hypothetical protein